MTTDADARTRLDAALEELLSSGSRSPSILQEALAHILERFAADVGTIHRLDRATGLLLLEAHRGLPPAVLEAVRQVPVGKGMAGLAAARCQPVDVCNLQTDTSGVARPNARQTGMQGSIATPMLVSGELRGTLGVGMPTHHEFSDEERTELLRIAARIGEGFG